MSILFWLPLALLFIVVCSGATLILFVHVAFFYASRKAPRRPGSIPKWKKP